MKITKAKLRRLVREQIEADPTPDTDAMPTINNILSRSVQEVGEAVHDRYTSMYPPDKNQWANAPTKSNTITYKFMSTYGAHDDDLWNRSTTKARQVVLNNLTAGGAVIEGSVPPMDDFGTPGVKFSLGGQRFKLITTGHRYDVEIYVTQAKQ